MRHLLAVFVLSVSAVLSLRVLAARPRLRQEDNLPSSWRPDRRPAISFSRYTVNGASVTSYTESGFTVLRTSGPVASSTYRKSRSVH